MGSSGLRVRPKARTEARTNLVPTSQTWHATWTYSWDIFHIQIRFLLHCWSSSIKHFALLLLSGVLSSFNRTTALAASLLTSLVASVFAVRQQLISDHYSRSRLFLLKGHRLVLSHSDPIQKNYSDWTFSRWSCKISNLKSLQSSCLARCFNIELFKMYLTWYFIVFACIVRYFEWILFHYDVFCRQHKHLITATVAELSLLSPP